MLKSGHKIRPVLGEEAESLCQSFYGYKFGMIRLFPGGWIIPSSFLEFADKYYDFEFRPSDSVVSSFLKVGSTWMQEIVWTLQHNYNLDNRKTHFSINTRASCMDADIYTRPLSKSILDPGSKFHARFVEEHPERDPKDGIYLQFAELTDEPRVFKTHLPLGIFHTPLNHICKVIYITRDPKDVIMSYYRFSRLFKFWSYKGTLSTYVDYFINDKVIMGPYWQHVKEAWQRRDHQNFHFCYYEDFVADPKKEIKRLADFLQLDRTDQQIDNVVEFTSLQAMRKRDNITEDDNSPILMNTDVIEERGGFYDKGAVGPSREEFSDDDVRKIESWIRKNIAEFDDDFKYKKKYIN